MKIITLCSVLGCTSSSNTPNIIFHNLPDPSISGSANSLATFRRNQWLDVLGLIDRTLVKDIKICSKHFISGHPAGTLDVNHIDWIPRFNLPCGVKGHNYLIDLEKLKAEAQQLEIANIINNLPEVSQDYDSPEFVMLDHLLTYNEDILYNNTLSLPNKASHIADHNYSKHIDDYKNNNNNNNNKSSLTEHNYSIKEQPACYYSNLRYFCNICRRSFKTSIALNEDLSKHIRHNDVTCSLCNERFFSTTCLNSHLLVHTSVCDICGCIVPKVQLKAHLEANKQQKDTLILHQNTQENEKVALCVLCMRHFKDRQEYLKHLKSVHVIRKVVKV